MKLEKNFKCEELIPAKVPNPETIAAIEEARRLAKDPNAERYSDVDSLMKSLETASS